MDSTRNYKMGTAADICAPTTGRIEQENRLRATIFDASIVDLRRFVVTAPAAVNTSHFRWQPPTHHRSVAGAATSWYAGVQAATSTCTATHIRRTHSRTLSALPPARGVAVVVYYSKHWRAFASAPMLVLIRIPNPCRSSSGEHTPSHYPRGFCSLPPHGSHIVY